MRKSSYQGDYNDPIGTLSKVSRQEEDTGRTFQNISEELKKEEQKVIDQIYREDQKEIQGLQTAEQKRENVEKFVEDFIVAQENERCSGSRSDSSLQDQISSAVQWEQRREVKKFVKTGSYCGLASCDSMQDIKLELFKSGNQNQINDEFRQMMLQKFLEYAMKFAHS